MLHGREGFTRPSQITKIVQKIWGPFLPPESSISMEAVAELENGP